MEFTRAQSDREYSGLGVLAPCNPARANTTEEFNYDTMMMEEVEGWTVCRTEVVPWPFSADEEGIAFDQANLYGVRTRVWRVPLADGGGDKEWWTAVPKTLPAEYTPCGRCHIGYARVADYIGSDPMSGFEWSHRKANGFIPDTSTDEGAARARWSPMNLNQQVVSGGSISESSLFYVPMPPDFHVYESYRTAALSSDHIGFRGGRATVTLRNDYVSYPITVSVDLKIASLPVTSSGWSSGGPPGDLVDYQTITISATFSGFADPDHTEDFDLDELMPDPGIRHNFIVYLDPLGSPAAFQPPFNASFVLSPRTDVPLPWFASQRNRVAPGGIIVPP